MNMVVLLASCVGYRVSLGYYGSFPPTISWASKLLGIFWKFLTKHGHSNTSSLRFWRDIPNVCSCWLIFQSFAIIGDIEKSGATKMKEFKAFKTDSNMDKVRLFCCENRAVSHHGWWWLVSGMRDFTHVMNFWFGDGARGCVSATSNPEWIIQHNQLISLSFHLH